MSDPNPNELAKQKLTESGQEILQCAWASQLAYIIEKEERIKSEQEPKKKSFLTKFSLLKSNDDKEEITDEDRHKKKLILAKLGITENQLHPVYSKPCCGVVIDLSDKTIAAFTGTDELKDWGINLNAMPTLGPDGKLTHGGIWGTLQKEGGITQTGKNSFHITDQTFAEEMRHKIASVIKDKESKKICYTGDSLGGGLAKLAVADHIYHDTKKASQIELYPFSAAPVGPFIADCLSDFGKEHMFSTARYGDIVSALGGATNAGINLTIHPDDSLSAEFRPVDKALDRFVKNTGVLLFSGINPLDAHRIDRVVEDLERILSKAQ